MLVVFKIKGGKNLKYKVGGSDEHWDLLYKRINDAIDADEPEVIYHGENNTELVTKAIGEPETFTTYVKIFVPKANLNDVAEAFSIIREYKDNFNYADLIVENEKYQLLSYVTI